MSPCDRVAECPDSTCAQVIHSNAEISGNGRVPVTAARECQEQQDQLDNTSMGRDLNLGSHRSLDLQLEYPVEVPIRHVGKKQNNHFEVDSSIYAKKINKGQLDLNSESPSGNLKYEAANLTGSISKFTYSEKDNTEYEASNTLSKILDNNSNAIKDSKEPPSVELSLKRVRGVKDVGMTVQVDRNVLRRSDSSAFSRYNTASNANKGPSGNIESASQIDNSLEVTKKGSACDIQSHSNGDPPNQSSNWGNNNMDMGSTTNNAFMKPAALKNKSEVSSTVNRLHPSCAFQPMKNDSLYGPHNVVSEKGKDLVATSMLAQQRGPDRELQIQHPTRCYENCHHHVHNMQQRQPLHDYDHLSLKKMAATVPHCGLSNVLDGLTEGNAGNHSVNGSASGSNHGSNGQTGSSTAVDAGGMNVESDNGIAGKSGSGSGSGSRVDQNKFSQREAALNKFRQKRKERCFRKRVRYQSRKRLAEQRPRVRGQFVRQTLNDNTSRDAES